MNTTHLYKHNIVAAALKSPVYFYCEFQKSYLNICTFRGIPYYLVECSTYEFSVLNIITRFVDHVYNC